MLATCWLHQQLQHTHNALNTTHNTQHTQLHGECRDPTCTDIHTDPPLPEGLGTRARAQSAVRLVGKVSIAMVERRAGSPVNGAGGPGLQELQEVSEEGGGVPASDQGPAMRAGHSQMSDSGMS